MASLSAARGVGQVRALAFVLALAACSPMYDWRDVRLGAGAPGLAALLPCKPDRAQKPVALAPDAPELPLTMIGCDAGGATFTLAHLHVDSAAEAGAALAQWRAATLARLELRADTVPGTPFPVAGALPLDEATMTSVERGNAGAGSGAAAGVQLRAAWFAAPAEGGGADLYQAAIQGRRIDGTAAETFFSNLRLR